MSQIVAIHPEINLLKVVAKDVIQRNHLQSAHIIFPNKRAVSFFEYYLSQSINHPCILPDIKPIEEWVKFNFISSQNTPPTIINEYDQAWLAYLATKEVFEEQKDDMPDWDNFLPWAMRLVNLFKELDMELVEAKDMHLPPEEKLPHRAVNILKRIGQIRQRFSRKLNENNFITYAKMIRHLAKHDILLDSPVYIVGFYARTRAEDRLFKKLYNNEAYIYWHGDPDNLPELYKRWQESWNVKIEPIRPEKVNKPEIFFFEASTLHSELNEVKNRLPEKITDTRPDKIAIVSVATENLIPIIHHLPEGHVNITMGYPINLTGIAVFLKSIFDLISEKDDRRGYRLKNLLLFLKNPYLNKTSEIEQLLNEYGAPYISYDETISIIQQNLDSTHLTYINLLFEKIIFPVENVRSPLELCKVMRNIFEFIKSHEDFSFFEETFLDSLIESVIYVIEGSLFSSIPMKQSTLFSLFQKLLSSVRVPFEGEPLIGLQVMGLLETRLLNFDEIFLLDVNESILPDIEEVNPLLPHEVRAILGLPDRQKQEVIIRYHFERLINTAKKVHIFWQFQTTRGAGLESVKVKSRYVEKLMWEVEKKEKVLFSHSSKANTFQVSSFKISTDNSSLFNPESLKKDACLNDIIKSTISTISPSLLNTYLECPLKFFYSRIMKISFPDHVDEISYDELGTAVHETLEDFYTKLTTNSRIIKKQDINHDILFEIFKNKLETKPFYQTFSDEKKFLLLKGAEYRFKEYLKNHPEETEIICLEKRFTAPLSIPDIGELKISGKIDRVDLRDNIYIVLDYKTGFINDVSFTKNFKLDIYSLINNKKFNDEDLHEINTYITDLQLPIYAHLFARSFKNNNGQNMWDKTTAAYIQLRENGKEKYFFEPDKLIDLDESGTSSEYSMWLQNDLPELIKFIVMHIINSKYWYGPISEKACAYCDFCKMCRYET